MGFAKETINVATSDGRNFTLLEPLVYTTNGGEEITAPTGTVTDGASTPREIWNLVPPFGIFWRATVLHDYLYRNTQRSREECDKVMLEAMESLGVGLILRETIYESVRLGGGVAFDDDRRVKLKAYMAHLAAHAP